MKNQCPKCNYTFDCQTALQGEKVPKKDDVSICINCYQVNQFNDDGSLSKAGILDEETINELVYATKILHQTKKEWIKN